MRTLHDGHRERIRKRYFENGVDGMQPHEVLELALFYAIPRKNTNVIAHELLNKFGTISAVFDAPLKLLEEVDGIGRSAAKFIKLIPELSRIYMEDKYNNDDNIVTDDAICDRICLKLLNRTDEMVAAVLLDAKGKLVYDGIVSKGTINSVDICIRKIVELVMTYNACSIVIGHNHPSGMAIPSNDDITTTKKLFQILSTMKVTLLDHIIVADNEYTSLRDSEISEDIFS